MGRSKYLLLYLYWPYWRTHISHHNVHAVYLQNNAKEEIYITHQRPSYVQNNNELCGCGNEACGIVCCDSGIRL
jgi:predicted nucleotide-binding protein (sugar kinase/HSP70/actin superfamily)